MKGLIKTLREIEQDCLQLKKENQLTEYGQGQLDLIKILNRKIKSCKDKYTVNDHKKIPTEFRMVLTGLMIANEIYHLRKTIQTKE